MRWWLTFRFGTVRCSFYFDFRIIRCPYDESDDDSEPYRERMTRARAARFGVFASDPANRRRERVCRGTGESGERRSIANHLVSQTYDPSLLARRAVAFQLAARAGAAVRAAAFQPTMRAGVAVRAAVFPLAMRTRFAVRALAFQLAMRAGLQSAQSYFSLPCGQGLQSAHLLFTLPCGHGLQSAQLYFSLPCGHGLQSAQLLFTLPCGQPLQSAHLRFSLPCGHGLQSAHLSFRLPCEHRLYAPIAHQRCLLRCDPGKNPHPMPTSATRCDSDASIEP